MKNFLKENWFKIIIVIIFIAIIGGIFYRWGWLPNRIRVKCNNNAQLNTSLYALEISNGKKLTDDEFNKLYNQEYQKCLRSEGLEK